MAARLSRGDFLKALGVAGAATAVDPSAVVALASDGAGPPRVRPTELSFSIRQHYRPFALLAERFVQLRDDFRGGELRYEILTPGTGEVSMAGGRLRVGGVTLLKSGTSQRAPFATVILDVESFSGPAPVFGP